MGEVDLTDYDDDVQLYVNSVLTDEGAYLFNYDGFEYHVVVEKVENDGFVQLKQEVWGTEEGPAYVNYFYATLEDGEVVDSGNVSYMDSATAYDAFATKNHTHVTSIGLKTDVWSFCDGSAFPWTGVVGQILYRDTLNSKAYLIEYAFSNGTPVSRYQKVQPLNEPGAFYQRTAQRLSGGQYLWTNWSEFNSI